MIYQRQRPTNKPQLIQKQSIQTLNQCPPQSDILWEIDNIQKIMEEKRQTQKLKKQTISSQLEKSTQTQFTKLSGIIVPTTKIETEKLEEIYFENIIIIEEQQQENTQKDIKIEEKSNLKQFEKKIGCIKSNKLKMPQTKTREADSEQKIQILQRQDKIEPIQQKKNDKYLQIWSRASPQARLGVQMIKKNVRKNQQKALYPNNYEFKDNFNNFTSLRTSPRGELKMKVEDLTRMSKVYENISYKHFQGLNSYKYEPLSYKTKQNSHQNIGLRESIKYSYPITCSTSSLRKHFWLSK